PAAAVTVTASGRPVIVRPRGATATTSPVTPASATSRLLPPPSTVIATPPDAAHAWAAATPSIDVARANHCAGPPTRSDVSGASATPASTAKSGAAIGGSQSRQRRQRIGARTRLEFDPVAGRELPHERQVGGNH